MFIQFKDPKEGTILLATSEDNQILDLTEIFREDCELLAMLEEHFKYSLQMTRADLREALIKCREYLRDLIDNPGIERIDQRNQQVLNKEPLEGSICHLNLNISLLQ